MGILIYECLFATTPFAAKDYLETYEMINRYAAGKHSIDYACNGVKVSKPARTIMQSLLHPNPDQVSKHAILPLRVFCGPIADRLLVVPAARSGGVQEARLVPEDGLGEA